MKFKEARKAFNDTVDLVKNNPRDTARTLLLLEDILSLARRCAFNKWEYERQVEVETMWSEGKTTLRKWYSPEGPSDPDYHVQSAENVLDRLLYPEVKR